MFIVNLNACVRDMNACVRDMNVCDKDIIPLLSLDKASHKLKEASFSLTSLKLHVRF